MVNNLSFQKHTQKYIINVLNAFMFSSTTSWEGEDQFDLLPILKADVLEENGEQRGCLLVHNNSPAALKLLITKVINGRTKVCYRITNLEDKMVLDNPKKVCYPSKISPLDFSISDLNFGVDDPLSLYFSDNCSEDLKRIYKLLPFLLNCYPVLLNEGLEIFDDIVVEALSWPPCAGDKHFKPIFGVTQDD